MNKKYLFVIGLIGVLTSFFLFKEYASLLLDPLIQPAAMIGEGGGVTPIVITLDEDGFNPNEITISQGQSITFQTTDSQFWPASDGHPSHNIYPEFDPLQPIDKKNSWTFVFDKVGTWYFHDHLYPSYKGKINVLDAEGGGVYSDVQQCDSDVIDEECWNYLIQKGWEDNGSVGALQAMAHLYDNSGDNLPENIDGCHRDTHRVGELAVDEYYKDLKNYQQWEFPSESFYCGYGYFHGVLEHLFRKINDASLIVAICESVSERYSDQFPAVRRNCYHGMGHGFMPEIPGLEEWGNPLAIVKTPLAKCSVISTVQTEVSQCYEGIFNVLADWMAFKTFGLKNNPKDPLFVCSAQQDYEQQKACYVEFGSRLPSFLNDASPVVISQYLEQIKDDKIATDIISASVAGLADSNPSLDISISTALSCREIAPRLQLECFKGVVGGLMAHGTPGKEYIKAVNLCEADVLTGDEKDECYSHLFRKFNDMYTKEKRGEVCEYIPVEDFKKECLKI